MINFYDYIKAQNKTQNASEYDAFVIHLYHHLPIAEVKQQTNLSYGTIYRILQHHDVKPYKRQKASHDLVSKYRENGLSVREIANLTDYTTRNVRNILKI